MIYLVDVRGENDKGLNGSWYKLYKNTIGYNAQLITYNFITNPCNLSRSNMQNKKRIYYGIYEITPAEFREYERFVEKFDTKEDAVHVLSALNDVNVNFKVYEIKEIPC